jgi:type III pantothenate kinase
MMVNARALSLATSKLPEVNIKKPPSVVAQTTETAIQSGIVNGHIAMIKGLVERIKKELFSESTGQKPTIVATGGFASLIADEVSMIDTVDPDLTLMGLMMLYRRAVAKTS